MSSAIVCCFVINAFRRSKLASKHTVSHSHHSFTDSMVDDKYRLSEGDNADMPEELRWLFASGDSMT